jgi:hypothetical protein
MDRQETCEIPLAPTGAARRSVGRRLTNVPGLSSILHSRWERLGDHELRRKRVGPGTETIRDQVRAGGKS